MKALFATTIETTLAAFLLPISDHLRRKGWRISALAGGAGSRESTKRSFDSVYDICWTRNPFHISCLREAVRKVREIAAAQDFDIIHVHTPVAAFATRWALRKASHRGRAKMIYTAHGFHFHQEGGFLTNAAFVAAERLAGAWTDYLVVINREDELAARRYRIVPENRIRWMPGIGIDTSKYDPACVSSEQVEAFRAHLRLAPEHPLLLMIAEFNPGKRHLDALRAFAALRNKQTHLAFVGEGPRRHMIEELAGDWGLCHRVHFLGHRDDIPVLIRASFATVLPSEREGLPRSIMESLSLQVPVIGTDVRGIRDLLQDGCGVLVPLGQPELLADAIDELLEEPREALAMGQRGRKKMGHYELSRIVRMHEELYSHAIGAKAQCFALS